jgi:hypothetical protein
MLEYVTLSLFSLVNALRIVAYLPQIHRAAQDPNGASAVSSLTWVLFLFSHFATIAYAIVNLKDHLLALVFSGNALACFAVVAVTAWKRRSHARRHREARPEASLQGCR